MNLTLLRRSCWKYPGEFGMLLSVPFLNLSEYCWFYRKILSARFLMQSWDGKTDFCSRFRRLSPTLYKDLWKFLQFQFWFYNNPVLLQWGDGYRYCVDDQSALYQQLILSCYICDLISPQPLFFHKFRFIPWGIRSNKHNAWLPRGMFIIF